MTNQQCLDISSLNIDKENVKTNLQELFKNPRLIWELYKTLSLSDTATLNYLEKLSHYCTSKKLYESIPNIDKFASSKKTLNSCFNWKIDDFYFLYMALLPSIFSSFKELYMGKTSWENWLNRLNDEDLQELSSIKVTPNDLSKKQIVSEIRNALNHTHYVPGKEELYIKNPRNSDSKIHAYDFEADVPYSFLIHFILLTQVYYRKADYYEFKIDDQELLEDLWENKRSIKYEDVKDKIHFFHSVNKEKLWDADGKSSKKVLTGKEVGYSEQEENIIWKYFSSHKLNKKNLRYISEFLIRPPEIQMWEIFSAIAYNEIVWSNRYKWLNCTELIDDVYEQMVNGSYYWFSEWFDSAEGKEFIASLWKELEKTHQPNWQSILKHTSWCFEFAGKYLRKHGFVRHNEWGIVYYKKWNIKVEETSLCYWIYDLCEHYYVINNAIKLFPNWLRLQLIKLVYVNEQVSLQNENVVWLISKSDITENEKGECKKPMGERIRDALSHHTYIILEWVDDIILRDGYDKKTDSWAWEATFSLSKLFENTFNELSKNNIVESYSSLQDFLKLLDN